MLVDRLDDPESVLIGQLVEDLGEDWQVIYRLAIQGSEQVIIAGLTVRPRDWRATGSKPPAGRGVTPGGLTARRLRSLRPATTLRDFIEAARTDPGRFRRAGGTADLRDLAELFGADAAAELGRKVDTYFFEWLELLRTIPAFDQRLVSPDRRIRLAQTAALYVQAQAGGHRAPRKRVAELQGRADASVRDDLYAARNARPPLLTEAANKGKAGGVLTDAAVAILQGGQR
jgi:hypothetical protein